MQPDDAESIALGRIEIEVDEGPAGRETGPVVERRVQLKSAVVVLELTDHIQSMRVVAVSGLRSTATHVRGIADASLRVQVRRGHRMDAMKFQRDVAAAHAVVPTGMLWIGRNRTDVIRTAQSVGRTRNGEQLVLAGDRITAIANVLGSFVGRAQDSEREAAGRAGQFCTPLWIDDAASMDGDAH